MDRHILMRTLLALLASCAVGEALAADKGQIGNARAGRVYAIKSCAKCHDVKAREDRPVSTVGAPDFHAIANTKTSTAIGLNVFLTTPHPTMPNLIIGENDRRNVIAYIMSFKDAVKTGPL